jgi:short-subunit dehydrogenase
MTERGARVAVCARNFDELHRANAEFSRFGPKPLTLQCDVTNHESVRQLVATCNDEFGQIDVLINNAGVIQVGPESEMTLDDFKQAMNTHYFAALHTMREVIPQMKSRGEGRIANISSVAGKIPVPHMTPYCGSKFALVGLSQAMRTELLQHGIYVTTVCPGLMRTGSHVNASFKGQQEKEFAWFGPSASAPLLAMSAERAAEQIIDGIEHGTSQLVLSLPAKLACFEYAIAPGFVTDSLALVNRVLPGAVKTATENVTGKNCRPSWLPRWLTHLGDRAAQRNNEFGNNELASN